MAELVVNGRFFSVDLVAFDKDGTLLDFHYMWGQKAEQWVETLGQQVAHLRPDSAVWRADLYRTLGYDPIQRRVIDDGPLAVAATPKLYNLTAVVLYQHGLDWHQAEELVYHSHSANLAGLPTPDLLRPLGDVAGAMRQLAAAGITIAIVTSDDRAATQATLPMLGITDYVSALVCGDDPLPNKPAPDGLYHLSQQFTIAPVRMLMVGDTASDMLFGRNAGVAGCVGISGGAGSQAALALHADVIVDSITAIQPR